jgi:TatD family-associated radical SAM protein
MDRIGESDRLWLEREPSVEEVIAAFDHFSVEDFDEIVFCGFGEPTEALDVLLQVAAYVKKTFHKPIRINTNGLGNLIQGRDITPELEGLVDTISISLNTPNADRYHELVRSKFGDQSFSAMIDFAKECTKYIPKVVMTTVDTTLTKEEEQQCRKICDDIGASYRIRPWEE